MKPIRLRLMNEYFGYFPLWGPDGPLWPEDLNVHVELERRLRAWATIFNEHSHEIRGFPTREMDRWYRAEGRTLLALVAEDLGPRYRVIDAFGGQYTAP